MRILQRYTAADERAYAAGNSLVRLEKVAAQPSRSYALAGTLYLSSSGYVLLSVPNNLVRGAFDALREIGAELPLNKSGLLNAHISVIRPEELERIGGPDVLTERGHVFHYTLGPLETVEPLGWSEVSRVWFIRVNSPELEKLRKSYGLSALPNDNKFAFHITVAVRRKHILRPNTAVSKAASHTPVVAVDLDGTICKYDGWKGESNFGEVRPGVKKALREFQRRGYHVAIFTCRGDKDAVKNFLQKADIPFDYVNENPNQPEGTSGKIQADVYIDDKAVNAKQSWSRIVDETVSVIDKRANASPFAEMKTLEALSAAPPIRDFLSRHNLVLGGGNFNYFDRARAQAMRDDQWDAMAQASTADKGTYKQLIHGLTSLAGVRPGVDYDKAVDSAADNIAGLSPYLMAIAPAYWDRLHGSRGSAASLASAMQRTHPELGAPANATMATKIYNRLYGKESGGDMRGLSARDLGVLYNRLYNEGLLAGKRGLAWDSSANQLRSLGGALRATSDAVAEQAFKSPLEPLIGPLAKNAAFPGGMPAANPFRTFLPLPPEVPPISKDELKLFNNLKHLGGPDLAPGTLGRQLDDVYRQEQALDALRYRRAQGQIPAVDITVAQRQFEKARADALAEGRRLQALWEQRRATQIRPAGQAPKTQIEPVPTAQELPADHPAAKKYRQAKALANKPYPDTPIGRASREHYGNLLKFMQMDMNPSVERDAVARQRSAVIASAAKLKAIRGQLPQGPPTTGQSRGATQVQNHGAPRKTAIMPPEAMPNRPGQAASPSTPAKTVGRGFPLGKSLVAASLALSGLSAGSLAIAKREEAQRDPNALSPIVPFTPVQPAPLSYLPLPPTMADYDAETPRNPLLEPLSPILPQREPLPPVPPETYHESIFPTLSADETMKQYGVPHFTPHPGYVLDAPKKPQLLLDRLNPFTAAAARAGRQSAGEESP